MANSFYNHGSYPAASSPPQSFPFRSEFDLVTLAFDKLPTMTVGNASKALIVNAAGNGVTLTVGTLALAGNFTTAGAFSTTFVQQADGSFTLPATTRGLCGTGMIRDSIYGLTVSNNVTDPTNDVDIAPGWCLTYDALDINLTYMRLSASITKRIDAVWAAGTGNGGMADGVTLTVSRCYSLFLALRSNGSIDAIFDSQSNGENALLTGDIIKVRRIAYIPYNSGVTITGFQQIGHQFNRTVRSSNAITVTVATQINIGTSLIPAVLGEHTLDAPFVLQYLARHSDPSVGSSVGPVYMRHRTNGTDDAVTIANANSASDVGAQYSQSSPLYLPWSSTFMSSSHSFLRANAVSTGNSVWRGDPIGWIDFREN